VVAYVTSPQNPRHAAAFVLHSYRHRFTENLISEFFGQITGCQNIDRNAQGFFQFNLDGPQVQQGGTRQRVNQQVQVAGFGVFSANDRAKDTKVLRPMKERNASDQVPMLPKNL
jgi:hypothetical protein